MKTKTLVAVVAFMMVAAGVAIFDATQESDANASNGLATYKFFFAEDGDTSWTIISGEGYNAFIALKAALTGMGISSEVNENYTTTVDNYTTINSEYGLFSSITDLVSSSAYSVFMYSTVTESWVPGPTKSLGFYQAYSDYDANLRTANIIIYNGTIETAQAIGIELPSGSSLASIFDVTTTAAFKRSSIWSVRRKLELCSGSSGDILWLWIQLLSRSSECHCKCVW